MTSILQCPVCRKRPASLLLTATNASKTTPLMLPDKDMSIFCLLTETFQRSRVTAQK